MLHYTDAHTAGQWNNGWLCSGGGPEPEAEVCTEWRPSYLSVPDVHTFVEGAACQMSAVGTEGHAVDGLLVFGECVDTDASLHVPETNRGVKGCTVDTQTVTTCSKMDAMTYHARLLGEGSLLLLLFVQLFHNIAPKDHHPHFKLTWSLSCVKTA